MISDWGIGTTIANAFAFSVTAFVTGLVTDALGQALQSLPGLGFLAYVIFFIVLPVTGFFSDVEEMIVRGLIFTVFVGVFSSYFFNDVGEIAAALVAFVLSLVISYWREYNF